MYQLDIKNSPHKTIAKGWLVLAVTALALAGLFSLPPVILRGPYFENMFDIELVFATALVIHVDMSVVVWMLSIGGMTWSLMTSVKHRAYVNAAFYLAVGGTILMALSPFIAEPNPLKNNYVPVLRNFYFMWGLLLFAGGVFIQSWLAMCRKKKPEETIAHYAGFIAAIITFIAFACFILALKFLPSRQEAGDHYFYEMLFWGGGHVLQFTFTVLTLLAWLWLANATGIKNPLPKKIICALIGVNALFVLPSPLFYLTADELEGSVNLFTQQMRWLGGISALFIGGALVLSSFKINQNPSSGAIKALLLFSIIMFGYGGVLGYNISGVNVTIPAHYHGSIVSMTLAFMGLVYLLLPQFGFATPQGKLLTIQPYIYGMGQWLHITGLAWMGGYGALRKDPGSSVYVENLAPKLMFFSGGALAILGGLLFVIVAYKAMMRRT